MLGRNHAMYAAASWALAYPSLAWTGADVTDPLLFGITTFIAAGSGVVPDLDHPDAHPSRHFGLATRIVAKAVSKGSGGHRYGTHTILFAAMLGGIAWSTQILPENVGKVLAIITCGFCCSLGVALLGPSLKFKVPTYVDVLAAIGPGIYVWMFFDKIYPLLWLLAAGGVICHICCDIVTKGGVPIFYPFSRKRLALHIFGVGGKGEQVAGALGLGLFGYGLFRAIPTLQAITTIG